MPTAQEASVITGEPRSGSDLVLEMIALGHQIALLKRSGTRRPCFSLWDRLFWILLSWWWPRWSESLMIIASASSTRRSIGALPSSFVPVDQVRLKLSIFQPKSAIRHRHVLGTPDSIFGIDKGAPRVPRENPPSS